MYRILSAAMMLAVLLLCAAPASAGSDKAWQELQSQLDLSQDQVEKLKPMLKRYQEAKQSNLQAFKQKVQGILTPGQAARFRQIKDGNPGADKKTLLQRVIQELGLTPEQAAQLKAAREERREQARQDRDAFLSEIRTVLSADQLTRFQSLLEQHERR